MAGHVLVVDDEPSIRKVIAAQLGRDGHVVDTAQDGEEAIAALSNADIDVVLTDLRMPGLDGMGLLRWMRDTRPEVPVVVLTAWGTVETAVDALKEGATDFLTKPFDQVVLRRTIERALATRRARAQHLAADTPLELLGDGPAVRAVRDVLDRVADTPVPVWIGGEPGTGKEVVARAIHDRSRRADGPYLDLHVGALTAETMAGELFGEVRTDGTVRPGTFQVADGGTVRLADVEQLTSEAQVALVQLLRDGTVTPRGGTPRAVDIRLIVTTEADLRESVESGRLRGDLGMRLAVVPIQLPALRDRLGDLPSLADRMLARARTRLGTQASAFTAEALARLASHHWPGNVRELETVVERAALLAEAEELDADDLVAFRPRMPDPEGDGTVDAPSPEDEALDLKAWLRQHIARLERQRILRALDASDRNVTHAARQLGISRRSLQTKMKEYGLRDDGT